MHVEEVCMCYINLYMYHLLGLSCSDILRSSPGCRDLSGFYWIEMSNGSAVQVHTQYYSVLHNTYYI